MAPGRAWFSRSSMTLVRQPKKMFAVRTGLVERTDAVRAIGLFPAAEKILGAS